MQPAVLALLALSTLAAPQKSQNSQRKPRLEPLAEIHSAGVEAWLTDPKDAALKRALRSAGDRLMELPAEFGLGEEESLALSTLVGATEPWTLRVAHDTGAGLAAGSPFVLDFATHFGAPARIVEHFRRVQPVLGLLGLDGPRAFGKGLARVPLPSADSGVWLGQRGSDWILRVGRPAPAPELTGERLLPEDATVALRGRVRYGHLLSLAMGGLPMETVADATMLGGVGSLPPADVGFEIGSDTDGWHLALRVEGAMPDGLERGTLPSIGLGSELFEHVPVDANFVQARVFSLTGALDALERLASGSPEATTIAEEFHELTGFELRQDLLECFDGRTVGFTSDRTGGANFASIVLLAGVAEPERLDATLERVVEEVNARVAPLSDGWLRAERRETDLGRLYVLTAPGLPTPIELVIARSGSVLVLALNEGPVRGVLAGGPGLTENPRWQAEGDLELDRCLELTWLDTPAILMDNYGAVAALGSALSNAVRRRGASVDGMGPLVPPPAVLAAGARGILLRALASGDDYLVVGRFDRSMLVNACGLSGYLSASGIGPLLGVGFLGTLVGPRVFTSLSRAEEAQARAELRRLESALELFAIQKGRYPDSLDSLITGEYLEDEQQLIDPWGSFYEYTPSADGTEYDLRCPGLED